MNNTGFENLIVWQKAHSFTLQIYKETKSYPKEEIYGLTSQFRRAATSIPANIAEGFGKKGMNDKLRFYNIAEGSVNECRYYIILSKDLGYIEESSFRELYEQLSSVQKLLCSYSQGLKNNISTNY